MRIPRFKVPDHYPVAFYHCLSRVVDKRHIFGPTEKEHFTALMRECERFCRVRVLTFAIMANHFHILLEVPQRPPPDLLPGPDEIVASLRLLSGCQAPGDVLQEFNRLRQAKDHDGLARYLASFHARMFDVSSFMKLLKQRFTQWFNGRSHRKGTLWEERFRSVLVDSAGHALATMAAYIDLNPVRAGLVRDPKDYRWCGYGEAMAGRKRAQGGIRFLATVLHRGARDSLGRSLETYRQYLFLGGDERREATGTDGRPVRGSLSAKEVEKVLAAKGRLPVADYMKCRVRYFCDGAVFGGKEFVEGIFQAHRKRFGPRRKSGARRVRGLASPELYAVRDLQVRLFGPAEQKPSRTQTKRE